MSLHDVPTVQFWVDEGFSTRAANALKNMGIRDWDALLTTSESELLRAPNFGTRSLQELKRVVAKRNGVVPSGVGIDPLREKALMLAIDVCRSKPEADIVALAAAFHAFLAGQDVA